ncbi:MAG: MOSC domain-containing protein [Caldilineaceae bacterium]
MSANYPYLHSIYIGQPKTIVDGRGEWQSSIYRNLVDGPILLEARGLVGDKATQPYHGTPELAVCCHFLDHYRFWNERYPMQLQPGNVGENWTLENISEEEICIGDIYCVGAALVQVSAPRSPCENQARRIGRADWVKLTLQELRTGIYLRVLEPGVVQAGDIFELTERLNPGKTIPQLNHCWYHVFDTNLAQEFTTMPGLMRWWQQRFAERLVGVQMQ